MNEETVRKIVRDEFRQETERQRVKADFQELGDLLFKARASTDERITGVRKLLSRAEEVGLDREAEALRDILIPLYEQRELTLLLTGCELDMENSDLGELQNEGFEFLFEESSYAEQDGVEKRGYTFDVPAPEKPLKPGGKSSER